MCEGEGQPFSVAYQSLYAVVAVTALPFLLSWSPLPLPCPAPSGALQWRHQLPHHPPGEAVPHHGAVVWGGEDHSSAGTSVLHTQVTGACEDGHTHAPHTYTHTQHTSHTPPVHTHTHTPTHTHLTAQSSCNEIMMRKLNTESNSFSLYSSQLSWVSSPTLPSATSRHRSLYWMRWMPRWTT